MKTYRTTKTYKTTLLFPAACSLMILAGCETPEETAGNGAGDAHATHEEGEDGHAHEDGEGHGDSHEHEHDEVDLGLHEVGDMSIKAAQGHGSVEAGKESHLIIQLPDPDDGATVVRAWLGTDDRTLSAVGKGQYAPSHDDYDIHAVAPDPLPEDTAWWIEIEKPDGSVTVGSIPILADVQGEE